MTPLNLKSEQDGFEGNFGVQKPPVALARRSTFIPMVGHMGFVSGNRFLKQSIHAFCMAWTIRHCSTPYDAILYHRGWFHVKAMPPHTISIVHNRDAMSTRMHHVSLKVAADHGHVGGMTYQ